MPLGNEEEWLRSVWGELPATSQVSYNVWSYSGCEKNLFDETKKVFYCRKEKVAKIEFPARILIWKSLELLR